MMDTMKLKLSEIEQNPFKKFIRNGELDKDRLDILKESIEHGTLPEHFFVRKHNNSFQLTAGHHRVGALEQVKGKDYEVDVTLVTFSDEQMLVDMVRENITQRDTDFHDTLESVVLARNWLGSKSLTVNQFNSELKKHKSGDHSKGVWGTESQPDSYRSIGKFLSKNGKAVSHVTVKNYLDIEDKLTPDLKEKIKKGTKKDGEIGQTDALNIINTTDDPDEQRDLKKVLTSTSEKNNHTKKANLKLYKDAPEEIKQKVRKGEIDIADVEDATIQKNIKEFNKNNPRWEFIPNFAGRLRQFDKDVFILEKQVRIFSAVFHDKEFKVKYKTLKPKQQVKLNDLISDISKRVKKCYEEVEYFRGMLGVVPTGGTVIEIGEGKK